MKTLILIPFLLVLTLPGCTQSKTDKKEKIEKIVITQVPRYNTFGYISGKANANPESFRIATFLFSEEGGGWFNKPYWATPTVKISDDSTFTVDVCTGGTDERATGYLFFIVPCSYKPPILKGGKIPQEMFDKFPFKKITRLPK